MSVQVFFFFRLKCFSTSTHGILSFRSDAFRRRKKPLQSPEQVNFQGIVIKMTSIQPDFSLISNLRITMLRKQEQKLFCSSKTKTEPLLKGKMEGKCSLLNFLLNPLSHSHLVNHLSKAKKTAV